MGSLTIWSELRPPCRLAMSMCLASGSHRRTPGRSHRHQDQRGRDAVLSMVLRRPLSVTGADKVVSDTGSMWASLSGVEINNEKLLLANLQLAPENEYVEGGRSEGRQLQKGLISPPSSCFPRSVWRSSRRPGNTEDGDATRRQQYSRPHGGRCHARPQYDEQLERVHADGNILNLYGLDPDSTGR